MIRDITIRAVLNGYAVSIGCQTLVFNSPAVLCDELERYLRKPKEVEQEYLEQAINAKHTSPLTAPVPVDPGVPCAIPRLGDLRNSRQPIEVDPAAAANDFREVVERNARIIASTSGMGAGECRPEAPPTRRA